jgi:hypothetical protein
MKYCKVCGRGFEARGRALYCSDECRKIADAKRKRDFYALKSYVKRNLGDYADGIEVFRETRGESRYATADDMAAEANSEGVTRLALSNDNHDAKRARIAPTAIGRTLTARVRGLDWGLTRPGCPRLVNGLSAEKGHCQACDSLLTDRPVDLTKHNMSFEMDYSYILGDSLGPDRDDWEPLESGEDEPGDDWEPLAAAEDGELDPAEKPQALTRADVDRVSEQHRPGCNCEECRAERDEYQDQN